MMSFLESLTSIGASLTTTNVVVDEDKNVNKKALFTTITGATTTSVYSRTDPIEAAEKVNTAKEYVESLSDEELSMYIKQLEKKENLINDEQNIHKKVK